MAKLIFRGIYKTEEQLPKADLPHNSVKFKEPATMENFILISLLFTIPSMLLIGLFLYASYLLHGELIVRYPDLADLSFSRIFIPLVLPFAPLIPHELLHVAGLGQGVKAELFLAPKYLTAFIVSITPIAKNRLIFMSFLPSFVLGWIPLLVWVILPFSEIYSTYLLVFSVISILVSCGDYLNIFNAIRQMPKGSFHQNLGLNSYWHIPEATPQPMA